MRVVVIGGGISGRLFQFLYPKARVLDWGPERPEGRGLTRNYGTNYLWEPLSGIECREFEVVTCVDGFAPTEESIARYKAKVGKAGDKGDWMAQFQHRMPGFEIVTYPESRIEYDTKILSVSPEEKRVVTSRGELINYDLLINTIPLNAFLNLIIDEDLDTRAGLFELAGGYRVFNSKPIFVRVHPRPLDAPYPPDTLYVNYLSSPEIEPYRYCDRGQERHFEGLTNMGVIPSKKLLPGKLIPPYPDTQTLLDVLVEQYQIFCFGRFAAWQPDELVHETYQYMRDMVATFLREVE
jgi:hypothetical protein